MRPFWARLYKEFRYRLKSKMSEIKKYGAENTTTLLARGSLCDLN